MVMCGMLMWLIEQHKNKAVHIVLTQIEVKECQKPGFQMRTD